MEKKCGKCDIIKPEEEFYRRKSGLRSGQVYEICVSCMRSRGIKYYHLNHDRQLNLALLRKNRSYKLKRNFINSAKNKPCTDCGIKYPFYVMDFDHVGGSTKINDIANMVSRNLSISKIQNEINKCQIVCANCHRIRTYKRYARVAKVVTAGA